MPGQGPPCYEGHYDNKETTKRSSSVLGTKELWDLTELVLDHEHQLSAPGHGLWAVFSRVNADRPIIELLVLASVLPGVWFLEALHPIDDYYKKDKEEQEGRHS